MIPLERASRIADRIVQILEPHTRRVTVAGSIRRRKQLVGDIDIVCIPEMAVVTDLLGPTGESINHVQAELDRLCAVHPDNWSMRTRGQQSTILTLHTPNGLEVQLDLWFATEATWPSVLLCRTGSREHNIWLAEYAKSRGFRWHPNIGLMRQDSVEVPAEVEEDIYHALGLPFIQPYDREASFLSTIAPTKP